MITSLSISSVPSGKRKQEEWMRFAGQSFLRRLPHSVVDCTDTSLRDTALIRLHCPVFTQNLTELGRSLSSGLAFGLLEI